MASIVLCAHCVFSTEKKDELEQHLLDHFKSSNPKICVTCGTIVKRNIDLKRHIDAKHLAKKDYVCDKCGESFVKQSDLRRHDGSVHSNVRRFECTFEGCLKSFKLKQGLKQHSRVHDKKPPQEEVVATGETDETDAYFCDYCGEKYYRLDTLERHQRMHDDKAHFFCTFTGCEYVFFSSKELNLHTKTH